ncbi:hypothetical protein ACFZC5_27715 [Nocardia gamkensis]|uniref:hypothetical protein n=1 Tax=Nocardia gamkensis TaxID=352869 RepID=UPI0036F07A78
MQIAFTMSYQDLPPGPQRMATRLSFLDEVVGVERFQLPARNIDGDTGQCRRGVDVEVRAGV